MSDEPVSTIYDPIMDALLALLREQCGDTFKTYGRKFKMWEDMAQQRESQTGKPVEQPALYLYDGPGLGGGKTSYKQSGRGTPAIRTLSRTIVIYARLPRDGNDPGGPNIATPGGSVLYPLIEAVETALDSAEPGQSLSQGVLLVTEKMTGHCWLEGDGVLVPGEIDPDGQGMATLPVSIRIP